MRYLLAAGALVLLTGCGATTSNEGPNYVKPEAAALNLNYISLTDRTLACQGVEHPACRAPAR
jgi:hypothetical protein